MDGLLLVHKPIGISSYDVIRRLKKPLRHFDNGAGVPSKLPKIGHAGTLDPFAEGLLVILFGRATKLSARLMDLKKTYEGVVCLGEQRDTDDVTGQVLAPKQEVAVGSWPLSVDEIEAAAWSFGERPLQVPPAFSAIHYQGQRLYDLARQGQLMEMPAREVALYKVSIGRYDPPEFKFLLDVGKGFYVRSWARDMGSKLKCGAYLKSLKRTAIGPFNLQEACLLEDFDDWPRTALRVISYDRAVDLLA